MIDQLEIIADKIPGTSIEDISGVPLVITEEHHHVFPFWYSSGIRNATLVHVDSHSDLADKAPFHLRIPGLDLNLGYYKKLEVGNFICPAIHYGVVKEIFWVSPFCKDSEDDGLYIQYLDGNFLRTSQNMAHIKWEDSEFSRKSREVGSSFDTYNYELGVGLTPKQFKKQLYHNGALILDIDLDAFAKEIYGQRTMVELVKALNPGFGVDGWEKRINQTIKLLKRTLKPNLITFTRSQGDMPYVPPLLVDDVQKMTLEKLRKLY